MEYLPSVLHVVYASDDKFVEILGVSLTSLYHNNQDMEDIIVYVLDSGISKDNKKKLSAISQMYHFKDVIFIPSENIENKLSIKVTVDRGSLSQYARLFVSSVLPCNVNRILYLDCDVIVNGSIRDLWNIDLQGKTIGALKDAFSKHYRKNIDLKEKDIMFNSGVMLINLKKWRKNEIENKVLNFIVKRKGRIQQGDQGALNAVLSYDTYCLEARFNSVTIFYDFSYEDLMIYRKPPDFYTKEQIQYAVDKPVIIHFTTSFLSNRAWVKGCNHRYVNEWRKYKNMSPWSSAPLWEDDRPRWKKKGVELYKKLPHGLAIRIAGFLQAYGRPFFNRIKIR